MEGGSHELELDSELVMSFYDQYQDQGLGQVPGGQGDLATFKINSALAACLDMSPGGGPGEGLGSLPLSLHSMVHQDHAASAEQHHDRQQDSIIELKPLSAPYLPPTPCSLSPPDVSSVTLLPCEGSTLGPQGATISWNLPDLLVGLEPNMKQGSSPSHSPTSPHTSFNLTSHIPSTSGSVFSMSNISMSPPPSHSQPDVSLSDTRAGSASQMDTFKTQPDSLLEGLGILTPPPVSMARIKTEVCGSPSPPSLSLPQYNLGQAQPLSSQSSLSDCLTAASSMCGHNFELSLAACPQTQATKLEPLSLSLPPAFSLSIANIDLVTGGGGGLSGDTPVPLSLDLIAQHCTLLPPELVAATQREGGEQILVPSLASHRSLHSQGLAAENISEHSMQAEMSPSIQDSLKEEDDCLDAKAMEVDGVVGTVPPGGSGPGHYKRCHLCVRIFSTKANLSSHIRHVHLGEAKHSRVKSIPCPHCNKMFSRKGHMTEHVRTVHEGKKRIYKEVNCQHCGKTFRRKWGLNIHISSAHADLVSSLVK